MWGKAVISDKEKVEDTVFVALGTLVGRLRYLAKSRTDGLSGIMSCATNDIGPDAGGAIALAAWRSYISHFVTYLECSRVIEVHSSWDDVRVDSSDDYEEEDDDDHDGGDGSSTHERDCTGKRKHVKICYPRRRFVCHCNVMTTKHVTFLGALDEYVASGSDDGSLTIFDKFTGRVLQVLRADGEVFKIFEPVFPMHEVHDIEVMREAINGRWRGIDAERMLFPPGTSISDRARRQGWPMPRAYSDVLGTSRRYNPSLTRASLTSIVFENEGLNFERPSGRRRSGDRGTENRVGTQLEKGS
ncbi:hypothetical protein BJ742DRAFT_856886 [Cladochytrium replicatum]|nr:hypothetical protein BJ742DRAFT_856886 [Cladochytrium replicatum]